MLIEVLTMKVRIQFTLLTSSTFRWLGPFCTDG
jgi:hypothetical protein